MESFNELKQYIDEADAAIRLAEAGKNKYAEDKRTILGHLTAAENLIATAISKKISSSDDESTVKNKTKEILAALTASKEEQIKLGQLQGGMKDYLDYTLKEAVTQAAQKVFGYRAFRSKVQTEMVATKLEIAGAIGQLKKYLIKEDDTSTVAKLNVFLSKWQATNFYEMTGGIKDDIVGAFEDAIKERIAIREKTRVKKGVYTTYIDALKEVLDKAIEYSENSGKCWVHCHRLRDKLDNNKYVNELRTELDVVSFEEDLTLRLGALAKSEERLHKRIIRSLPEGQGAKALEKVAATKVPKEIDWLKAAYGLASWVYETHGESVGERIGLPKEATFKFELKTPDLEVEVGIPVFHCGIASLELEFGASLAASVSVNGALTLHNFFSHTENKIVSGDLNAAATVEASAFVGLALTLVEIIKASGRIVLTAKAGVSLTNNVSLLKSNIEGYPALECKSDGGIELVLSGHLEAVLGLTAALKTLIKAVTGKKAELKVKTPPYNFFSAKRNAVLTFELPMRKKPTSFPKDSLNFSKGEWKIDFIAKQQLTAFWKAKFGGVDKWKSKMAETPLTPSEIEELHTLYANFGIRAQS